MIKLRFTSAEVSPFGEIEFPVIQGSTLKSEIYKYTEKFGSVPEVVFIALVNGDIILPEKWDSIVLKESDSVLIAPSILSGDSGQMIKQVGIMAVTLLVSSYYPPAASMWNIAIVASANIAATLALNAMIPPPVLDAADGLSTSGSFGGSQVYSISGQSNQAKKLKSVPKVYGSHRMFPNVAATPYVEIETDPATGELAQYLYAVYDFGLGPMNVSDIKIGDTPINYFKDCFYRLVDFNKPAVSEGYWDDILNTSLLYYRGDVTNENLAIVLTGNRESSDPMETWEAVRTTGNNPESLSGAITLTFVNQQGLYGYSSTGEYSERTIDLEIYFKKLGTDDWRAFNDLDYVDDYKSVGGYPDYGERYVTLLDPTSYIGLPSFSTYFNFIRTISGNVDSSRSVYGLRKNVDTEFYVVTSSKLEAHLTSGSKIYWQGKEIGVVQSLSSVGAPSGYVKVTLVTPPTFDVDLYVINHVYPVGGDNPSPGYYTLETSLDSQLYFRYSVIGKAKISRNSQSPVYSTFSFTPKEVGQYDVKVTRVSTASTYTTVTRDDLTWSNISTRLDAVPIVTTKRHVFMEVKIRATNQLNGTIQNLSAVCESVLPVWNGVDWQKQVTSNPAWIFCDLLTGEVNKKAISNSRLHLPSISEWANFCDEVPTNPPGHSNFWPRFSCNFVLDYDTTLSGVINQVCGASQSSLNIIDGKYGVLIDRMKTTPVQIFTPRNSWGFTSSRAYTAKPHCLNVKFIDPAVGWEIQDKQVYDDGYTSLTATEIQDVTTFGATNHEQAWRFGRYLLAQNRLRQETMQLNVDFEHLVCTRGDYVQIAQDVMKVGGNAARVTNVAGDIVTIDTSIDTDGLLTYGYAYRTSTGEIKTGSVTVLNAFTFQLPGPLFPSIGDLIVIGETGRVTYDCLVKSITPNDDLSATLVLVEKADGVYASEYTGTIPDYNPELNQNTDTSFYAPSEVEDLSVVDNFWECNGDGYRYYIDLDWDAPVGSAYETFQIFVNTGTGFKEVEYARNSFYKYIVEESDLGKVHYFKVLAVSATGKKKNLGEVSEVSSTPLSKTTRPSDVSTFSLDVTNEVLQLSWTRISDCDCSEYLIRYNPTLTGTWEESIPLTRVDRRTSSTSVQARVGTYLIKAIDFNGNESTSAMAVVTTVPELSNLNVVANITDFPALPGSKDRVVTDGVALTLDKAVVGGVTTSTYYSDGYYYYDDILDLGDIYTVRLQSLIQAQGYSGLDLMGNWTTLSSVSALANTGSSEWDVETEYRTTDSFNSIDAWASLSAVPYMSSGSESAWTSWKKFTIGDATGRIFQFRLRLVSNVPSVTPRVFDGTIKADMPDRVEKYNNLTAPTSGLTVVYSPSFYGPGTTPAIQISMESASSGDYWTFDHKNLDEFKITFYDKNNVAVARSFDAAILGYGRKNTASL